MTRRLQRRVMVALRADARRGVLAIDKQACYLQPSVHHPPQRAETKDIPMTQIFVNIPTSDLERSKAFYTALGAGINPLFTDENAACIVWDENIFFMVLTTEYLSTFTEKPIIDPRTHAQARIALSRDSRADVDSLVEAGLANGGSEPKPATDLGFMYSRDLEDPDGNILEFLYMDPAAAEQGPEAFLSEQGQA
jgi:predicted lactoylglutathione lyase